MEKKLMVNFSTIAIIGGIGLLFFFRKDLGQALESFKGFGSEFGRDFGKLPDININVPSFGLPEAFAETGKVAGDIGAGVQAGVEEAVGNINQFGIDVQKNIGAGIEEAQKGIDLSIKETQQNFEQFGKDVQTNINIIGTGISDFFGGIFPTKEITTVSEAVPIITSRRAGTTTRFGGQTAPKEILTREEATTPELIISKQPDLSLVSPFLTAFQKTDPEVEPVKAVTRFSGSGSRR